MSTGASGPKGIDEHPFFLGTNVMLVSYTPDQKAEVLCGGLPVS